MAKIRVEKSSLYSCTSFEIQIYHIYLTILMKISGKTLLRIIFGEK